jgi:penicillin G amidase
MLAIVAAIALQSGTIERDAYGVPHISAPTLEAAFQRAGYAVAQDRLWQMENSRRVARGRMAEAFGPTFAASDREVLSFAYTDQELQAQISSLSPKTRAMLTSYVRGVNAWIDEAKLSNKLPTGYSQNDFQPEPWTELDSAAVAIRLFQLFGKGGAGEIRNMALLGYLQGRAETKDRVLDILEDFAWFNDRSSIPTIAAQDDPLRNSRPDFAIPSRATTEKHVAALPKVSLLELLPGVRLAEMKNSRAVAELVSAPSQWGSYAVVVGPSRSATGYPILLSAPQMGFRTPSVIHEMSISAPGYEVVGMDVPGVPGIAIGHSRDLAWGLTSGVADTDDIVYNPLDADGYTLGGVKKAFDTATFQINVKGGSPQTFVQKRTQWGPVVIESRTAKVVFSRRSASRGKELQSLESVSTIGSINSAAEVEAALQGATVNFNCFYATSSGDIGYRYTGLVPLRATGHDPRFPVPGETSAEWRGMIPFEKMPHVRNPKGGLLANWNNKPVEWWPNSDTPVWGRVFRNSELLAMLQSPKLAPSDVERAAWTIARKDETWPYFRTHVEKAWKGTPLEGFDGWMLDGSIQAQTYRYFFDALREELFLPITGNFVSPDNFRLVAQPSVMLSALEGKTKVDYLRGRSATAVVQESIAKSLERRPTSRFAVPSIAVPDQAPIPYSNRGSYIQIVELTKGGVLGRNVVTPGVAESGPHAFDQVPLARAWTYKPMLWRP